MDIRASAAPLARRRRRIRIICAPAGGAGVSWSAASISRAIESNEQSMEIVLGFLIAVAIGITGVGAGIITAPVLILFFHLPPARAVGTALAFGVAVKLLVVPMQVYRGQVSFRALGYMLAGGLPGVLIGSVLLARLNTPGRQGILFAALGSTIVLMAALNLYRLWLRPAQEPGRDRTPWLPLITL